MWENYTIQLMVARFAAIHGCYLFYPWLWAPSVAVEERLTFSIYLHAMWKHFASTSWFLFYGSWWLNNGAYTLSWIMIYLINPIYCNVYNYNKWTLMGWFSAFFIFKCCRGCAYMPVLVHNLLHLKRFTKYVYIKIDRTLTAYQE